MKQCRWSNYADFYQNSDYSAFCQEHRHSPGKLPFRMILVEQEAHSFCDPMLSESIIALPLKVAKGGTLSWCLGSRSFSYPVQSGRMLVVPANTDSTWDVTVSRTLLILSLPNKTVSQILGRDCPHDMSKLFKPLTEQTWEDPLTEILLNQLWQATDQPSTAGGYLADGLLTAILSQLLLLAQTELYEDKRIALPLWRLNRVRDFALSHLSEDIQLQQLAQVAGLSIRHFSRNFQKETGESPHRWLVSLRSKQAVKLLQETELPISEIAIRCGFSSQSHLTTTLKKLTGSTPNHWRRKMVPEHKINVYVESFSGGRNDFPT